MLDVPDNVLPYFDFEAYGRDVRINEGGHFAPGGYVFNNGGSFVERYHGMENIPPEHRIFAYPKLNIREYSAKQPVMASACRALNKSRYF